jgi:cytochrome c
MKEGYVYYIRLNYEKIKSAENDDLWVSEAFYTHNNTSVDTLPIKKVVKPASPKTSKTASTLKPTAQAKPVVNTKEQEAAEIAVAIKEGPALLEKRGCRACHAFDKKVLGPGYYEVAAKYRNDPKAYDYLIKKVTNGGGGVWGEYAMASQTHVPKADIKKMVRYILSLK